MSRKLFDSVLAAVSDGTQREWTSEEINFIASDLKLQEELIEWFENSISDCCWHPHNYETFKKATNYWSWNWLPEIDISKNVSETDISNIPF